MFLTRIGENSKIVINGDPSQIDLPNKNFSGLDRSKNILGHLDEISIVDFDHKDVVRHPLVSKIVKAYSAKKIMINVEVLVESSQWTKIVKSPKINFENYKKFSKKYRFINKRAHISLLLTNNKKIKYLNKKFRKKIKQQIFFLFQILIIKI